MSDEEIIREAMDTLAVVTRLLQHATNRAAVQAAAEGPRSPAHMLGWGIQLAACQAVNLVPVEVNLDGPPPTQDDIGQLLRAAEELTRHIPVIEATFGLCPLVVAICDLIGQSRP